MPARAQLSNAIGIDDRGAMHADKARIEPLQEGDDAGAVEMGFVTDMQVEIDAGGADPVEILQLEKRHTAA